MKQVFGLPSIAAALLLSSFSVMSVETVNDADSNYSSVNLSRFDSWNEMKQKWDKEHGLQLNTEYNILGFNASDPLGESTAAGGALRVYGQWNLLETDSGSKGGLVFKFEHRHKYTDSSPKDFGVNELGYVGFIHSLYGDQGFRTTHLFWKQSMLDEKMVAYAGFLDMTDYTDLYALASPWTDFNNLVFAPGNGTIGGLPDGALGVMLGGFLSDHIYGSTSIMDAKGNASDLFEGAKDFLSDGATWKSVELGYTLSKNTLFLNNAHVSLWQRDAVDNDLAGYGLNVSISGLVADQWIPFIRGGWAEDGGAIYDSSISAGFGYIPAQRANDMFGVGFNRASVMSSTFGGIDLDTQYTAEIYYRAQINSRMQLVPSLQVMNHTAINLEAIELGEHNNVFIKDKTDVLFGVKARVVF
ncbi:carbohydrate porin [Vibrio sp. FNV 38]|nr:carbohydrate porin [Vibrio sp. FNV 38]